MPYRVKWMMITGIWLAVFIVSANAMAWQFQHGRYGGPLFLLTILSAVLINEGFRKIFGEVKRSGGLRRALRKWANNQKDVPNDSYQNQRP